MVAQPDDDAMERASLDTEDPAIDGSPPVTGDQVGAKPPSSNPIVNAASSPATSATVRVYPSATRRVLGHSVSTAPGTSNTTAATSQVIQYEAGTSTGRARKCDGVAEISGRSNQRRTTKTAGTNNITEQTSPAPTPHPALHRRDAVTGSALDMGGILDLSGEAHSFSFTRAYCAVSPPRKCSAGR